MKKGLLILLFLGSWSLYAMKTTELQKVDSLLNLIKETAQDSVKIDLYLEAGYLAESYDMNQAITLYSKAIEIAELRLSVFIKADSLQKQKLIKDKETRKYLIRYEKGLRWRGIVYYFLGKYPEALANYRKSLNLAEMLGEKLEYSKCLTNIALLMFNQKNYDVAQSYATKSLEINSSIYDTVGIISCYNILGNIYNTQQDYEKALMNYNKALKFSILVNDLPSISTNLSNIGTIYKNYKNYSEALSYFNKSLEISESLNDRNSISIDYNNISNIYLILHQYDKALEFAQKSIKISQEIGLEENLKHAYAVILESYASKGNYKKAYEVYNVYTKVKDSLINNQSNRLIHEMEAKYQNEKKQQEIILLNKDKELHKTEIAKQEAEVKQQTTQKYAFIVGFIFALLLSLLAYRSFIQKKRANHLLSIQNNEIKQQKEEISAQRDEIEAQRDTVIVQKNSIEEQKKEITDSITYAKRIQNAILPTGEYAKNILGDHFILFKPKDIVSGDFYWSTRVNEWLIIAVADCTGHGVPGAFMSMLGVSFLNEIVRKKEVTKASDILNHLRGSVIEALQQKGNPGEQADGMDISLLVINTLTNEAQWAGANNPLYIVKPPASLSHRPEPVEEVIEDKGVSHTSTQPALSKANVLSVTQCLVELKGDKMPIAIYPQMKEFTNHEFTLQKGDCVYLFTDGYADQFGGPLGRKFMYKQFKEILNLNSQKSMKEQKEILEVSFKNWTGNYSQIDDVTVLGIRI